MAWREEQVYYWNNLLYVPYHTVRIAGGPFLSLSWDSIEEYLELDPNFFSHRLWSHSGGIRMPLPRLAAARVHGNSMINKNVRDGDIIIFQRGDFDYVQNGMIVVIEKIGEDEGLGAWALKKLVIERPRSSVRDEHGDERDWDNPLIVLRSYNLHVSPAQLDPTGQHRVHGIILRRLPRDEASLVDSALLRQVIEGAE